MSELLPCPFCGGEAYVNDDPTGNGGKPHIGLGRLWSVECDECGADGGFWQDRGIAIAAWNTRADYHGYEQAAIEAWKSIKAWNKVEAVEIERVDFIRKPDDKSRWHELFGTPERAARTLVDSCNDDYDYGCGGCPVARVNCKCGDYDALLEWLKGGGE